MDHRDAPTVLGALTPMQGDSPHPEAMDVGCTIIELRNI